MQLSVVLTPEQEGGYVAYNPETGTTTQSETIEEALDNLREATELRLSGNSGELSDSPCIFSDFGG
jgi:predicted RNase H-like HicB family nuclease